jgi:hypothetical protein
MLAMNAQTPRRTDAVKLRQTISQLLDQVYVIEDSMETFHRKGDRGELDRAADSFGEMLGHVDRLGDIISEARATCRTAPTLVAKTAV